MADYTVGFLGCGKMAMAMMSALDRSHLDIELYGYDIQSTQLQKAESTLRRFKAVEKNQIPVMAEWIFLAVKPGQETSALKDLPFQPKNILITMLAGTPIQRLKKAGAAHVPICRIMPNINAMVGHSSTALYIEENIHPQQKEKLINILKTFGKVHLLSSEKEFSVFTALAGSGPAFVFSFVHALTEGGVLSGMAYDTAYQIALEVVEGSIAFLRQTKLHPGEARNRVTSPGGTTIFGLQSMEKQRFAYAIRSAVFNAKKRAEEL